MESPGEYLKREREQRGVSLARIFEATRVPMKYLEALERDDYDGMPHPTFIKGYIKTYCKVLGLDETDAVLRFEVYMRERAAEADRAQSPRPAPRKKAAEAARTGKAQSPVGLKAAAFTAVGVAIVAIIYIVAVNRKGPAPVAEAPRAAVEETTPAGEAGVPPQEAAQPVSVEGQKAAEAAKTTAPQRPEAVEKTAPQKATERPAVAAPQAPTQLPQAATEGAEKRHTLQVSATEQAWVKVQIDGSEPFDVILREGERVSWKAAEDFQLTVGNAGGVDVTYNGKALPRLGESGQVVHMRLPGEVPAARPMPAPVAPKETGPAINMPEPGPQTN